MTLAVTYQFPGQKQSAVGVSDGDASKPVVILIHGTSGSSSDMTTPALAPDNNFNYSAPFPPDRDVGWRWYPGIGVWSFTLDSKKDVTSWSDTLERFGFRTVTWDQVDNTGLLQNPVDEFKAIFAALTEALPATRFALVAHSRGGLLVRKFLKDNPRMTSNIGWVITLHSPNQGSDLANVADTFAGVLAGLRATFGSIIDDAFGWLESVVDTMAYQQMAVGSPFLLQLQDGERALPGISYFSFGGTSVRLTRICSWVYTLGSAVPQWRLPPFHHFISLIEVPLISPVANSLPPLTPEITNGAGDILTANARCVLDLPGAVHQANPINHAEALWDPALQDQVLRILGVDLNFWQ